jgi:hypothetical protein
VPVAIINGVIGVNASVCKEMLGSKAGGDVASQETSFHQKAVWTECSDEQDCNTVTRYGVRALTEHAIVAHQPIGVKPDLQ